MARLQPNLFTQAASAAFPKPSNMEMEERPYKHYCPCENFYTTVIAIHLCNALESL